MIAGKQTQKNADFHQNDYSKKCCIVIGRREQANWRLGEGRCMVTKYSWLYVSEDF